MQIPFHSLLLSYLPRVPIFLAMTVFNLIKSAYVFLIVCFYIQVSFLIS